MDKASGYRFDLFHPDFTVAIGITPIHAEEARGVYRRWGNEPRPENLSMISIQLFQPISPCLYKNPNENTVLDCVERYRCIYMCNRKKNERN